MSDGKLSARLRSRAIGAGLSAVSICVLLLGFGVNDQLHAGALRSPLTNAYCKIPTFVIPVLPGEARAVLEDGVAPLILVDATTLERRDYTHFLLAHECCHHKLGHLPRRLQKTKDPSPPRQDSGLQSGSLAPRSVFSSRSSSTSRRHIELEADCCAARQLALLGDAKALTAAIKAMSVFGRKATGPAYPSGLHRAAAIKLCAGLE